MNSSHLMYHFDDGISLIPCSFLFHCPCFKIGVLKAKESWGTLTAIGTTSSSITSALVLEARASKARLLLTLKSSIIKH